jgi:glycosyltransferase involved in cell wall biosynthesis
MNTASSQQNQANQTKLTASPLVSIVMPVKDGADFVGQAIESLLNQTLTDFELIVINDGSTDNSVKVIEQFKDPRITLLTQENQGVSKTSNRGLTLCRGKYITRHDHDDLSFPTRLSKQVNYLDNHLQCGLLGTAAEVWTQAGPTGRYRDFPTTAGAIAFELIFDSPFVLSSVMFRREVMDKVGIFSEDPLRTPMEDFEFISRVGRQFEMANLAERLVVYREVPNSESSVIRPNHGGVRDKVVSRIAIFSSENLAYANELTAPNENTINFGAINHWYFKAIVGDPNYAAIRQLVKQAAELISIRYREPEVIKMLDRKLSNLDYQYYTYSGQKFKRERIMHILRNRSIKEHCTWLWQKLQQSFKSKMGA